MIAEIKSLSDRYPQQEIRKRLKLSREAFAYLIGKAGLEFKQNRNYYSTKVLWTKQTEKGKIYYEPNLRVSRAIVRTLQLTDKDSVLWTIENERIIGTLLKGD